MICKKCGTENPDTFDWCSNCGEMLKKEDMQGFELNSGQEVTHTDDVFSDGVPDLSSEYNPYDNATENPAYWQKPKDSKSDVILKRVLGGCGIGCGVVFLILVILVVFAAVFAQKTLDSIAKDFLNDPSGFISSQTSEESLFPEDDYLKLIYTGYSDDSVTAYYELDMNSIDEFEAKYEYTAYGHFYSLEDESAKISETQETEPVIYYIDENGNRQSVYVCGTYETAQKMLDMYDLDFSSIYINMKTDVPASEMYATEVYFVKEDESTEETTTELTNQTTVNDGVFKIPHGVIYKVYSENENSEIDPYYGNPCGIIVDVNVVKDSIIQIETDEGKVIRFVNSDVASKRFNRDSLLGYDAYVSGYRVDETILYADVVYLLETEAQSYMDV